MKRALLLLSSLVLACSSSNDDQPNNNADTGAPDAPIDAATDPLLVTTDRGPVRGIASGAGAAFFDIPFAKAERFAAPMLRDAWTDVRDATKRGPACPQGPDAFSMKKPEQAEDCLALNVWTPKTDPAAKAPVMVFIHGGSFTNGSGNQEIYDGGNLMARGVVVVTINYRLGALGFLGHSAGAGGNFGILDQQAALRWVQANIEKFGGDAGNVTIFGESAGAISVCLHVVAPGSKGLFQKAISQSGTCALVTAPLKDPGTPAEDSAEERGARFAKELGCTSGDVLACLRSKSVDEILAKSTGGGIGATEFGFPPVIDGTVIPSNPGKLLVSGPANDVPYMIGANADEATIFTTTVTINTAAEYESLMRTRFPLIGEELLKIYPAASFPTPKDAYNAFLGDALFVCPARESAKAVSARVPSTHLYYFTHVTSFAKTYKLGAFHASELWFVFGNFAAPLTFPTAEEKALAAAMGEYWTSFAKTGTPAGTVAWPKYSAAADQHLVLGTPIAAGTGMQKDRCDALKKLVP